MLAALAVLGLIAGTSSSQTRLIVDALETHSSQFTLPEFVGGTVTFQRCGRCPFQSATSNAATIFEVSRQRVTLAEMKRLLAEKPTALAVLYRVEDNTLVRISAY
jgi:hypothetical protein